MAPESTGLPGMPSGPRVFDYDNPEWARQLILQLRYNLPKPMHGQLATIARALINQQLGFRPPPGDPRSSADAAHLETHGFCRLGRVLDDEAVATARGWLEERSTVGGFRRSDAPASVNVGDYSLSDVVTAPHLRDVALSPAVLHRVSRYLKAPPTIPFMAAWWSFAGRPAPKDAQLFHVDFHDFRWVKLFVYLTDVTEADGPHVLIRGSHDWRLREARLKELNATDPSRAAALARVFESQQRIEDADVVDVFGADRVVTLAGQAGEAFLVDTAAYHKGMLPLGSDRLVFQALYTLLPTIKDPVDPVAVPGAWRAFSAVHGEVAVPEAFWRYATRLVLVD